MRRRLCLHACLPLGGCFCLCGGAAPLGGLAPCGGAPGVCSGRGPKLGYPFAKGSDLDASLLLPVSAFVSPRVFFLCPTARMSIKRERTSNYEEYIL